ncbi:hypothetical protein EU527_19310 [Candidatus Thorarchaeota archaeon]|nr:MAG: hypothetical protein EU527_19310 [Candidatus Thorarchaeota archaeon]
MSSGEQNKKESLLRLRDKWREVVAFRITIIDDGNCRANHKIGEKFEFSWRAPAGICTESLVGMYPILHSMRVFGDMRELGSSEPNVRVYNCPSREIKFRIEAIYKCSICAGLLEVNQDGIQSSQLRCTKPDFPIRVCETCYYKYKDKRIEW